MKDIIVAKAKEGLSKVANLVWKDGLDEEAWKLGAVIVGTIAIVVLLVIV